jgi:hypothetical protein
MKRWGAPVSGTRARTKKERSPTKDGGAPKSFVGAPIREGRPPMKRGRAALRGDARPRELHSRRKEGYDAAHA